MIADVAPRRWQQIQPILDRALELTPEDRGAWLEEACGDDSELRTQVDALVAAEARAGEFLETPAVEVAAVLLAAADDGDDPFAGRQLGPYRIVRRIGAGGMGEVYEARDERLRRRVALKLLPPEWSRDAAAKERFLREARAASTFDHPNICTVHDLGEADDGRLYIVLAHYEGESLGHKIDRGPLPVAEALDLAVQVARGLERAHEAGVIHRDVKPANVIVTAHGDAKILDFGIAKVADATGLTHTGVSPGTPAYMSPEQAAGEPVDSRTDIWSLGVMLYEMLAGRRPFQGDSAMAVLHVISSRDPAPLGGARPEVPAALERAVAKALEKDPARRYQRVAQLRADLEAATAAPPMPPWRRAAARGLRPAAATLGAVLLLAGGFRAYREWAATDPGTELSPAAAEAAVPVVGVIPFTNRTGDRELDWVGEGIARLVRDNLSQSRHLHVVSELRVAALRDAADPSELARHAAAAGIEALLTGEILPGAEGLTMAARLGATAGGRQLAARRVDGLAPEELLDTAAGVAREARKGLGVPPTEAVDIFAADFAAENPAAYDLYLRGLRAFADYRYDEAEDAFAAALEEAPGFTMARYRLAYVAAAAGRTDAALAEIRRAVAESDRLPDRDARYVRALEAYIDRRLEDAIAAYRGIVEHYPYETEARSLLAILLQDSGRYEEVLEVVEALARLEPENHTAWSLAGWANLALGNLHQAVLNLERYLEFEPDSANGHALLGDAYRAQEELDLAAEQYAQALAIDPAFHFATIALAVVDVLRGHQDLAEERLARLVADSTAHPRYRIDAVFELSSLVRSQGRFGRAIEVLESREALIAGEKVREALALSVRGLSHMELGDYQAAAELIDRAIERSPTAPTRYLFARGLLELRQQRFEALDETVARILRDSPPPDQPNRKTDKAAAYLRGLRQLAEGRAESAVGELSRAVALEGYEYARYRLGLARAYLAAGKPRQAMAASRQESQERDLRKPRLDLELDRNRAQLVLAEAQLAMGRPEAAAEHARHFLERWASADPGPPDLAAARRLTAGG